MNNNVILLAFEWSVETGLIGLGIGIVVAAAVMFAVRSKLKSVRTARTACNYTRRGSFKVTGQRDSFLFRNVTRTPIQRNNNNSSSRR